MVDQIEVNKIIKNVEQQMTYESCTRKNLATHRETFSTRSSEGDLGFKAMITDHVCLKLRSKVGVTTPALHINNATHSDSFRAFVLLAVHQFDYTFSNAAAKVRSCAAISFKLFCVNFSATLATSTAVILPSTHFNISHTFTTCTEMHSG